MRKFIILALAAVFGALSFAPVASAAPYLSMARAKSAARRDAREIASYDPTWLGSCYRVSRSRVVCNAYTSSDGMECTFTVGERMTSYGRVLFYDAPGETDCY
jgi:hypothetical protein